MMLTRLDIVVTALVLSIVTAFSQLIRRRRQLRDLPGPKSNSFLLGVEYQLQLEDHAAESRLKWAKEHGPTYKIPGYFGVLHFL
jgi:hypothetical protein